MLTRIGLTNFKCFGQKVSFECGRLNVFMGANGLGKSSVAQSILLLSQSALKNQSVDNLIINGDYVSLDKFVDLLYVDGINKRSTSFSIELHYSEDVNPKHLKLTYQRQQSRTGILKDIEIDGKSKQVSLQGFGLETPHKKNIEKSIIYNKEEIASLFYNIVYISANRLGPTRREIINDINSRNPVGKNGEHRLNVLRSTKARYIIPLSTEKVTLTNAVNYWMKEIMNGYSINVHGIEDDDADVLSMTISKDNNRTRFKSINSGFGYSYILSVIESVLLSQNNSIIFIENPEAHLHPAAQSRLAKLFVWAANNGRQIYVETHSEHILDGLRVWVTKDEVLQKEDLAIHYFNSDGSITQMHMDKWGFLEENAPTGFCDQSTVNSLELFRLRFLEEQIHED